MASIKNDSWFKGLKDVTSQYPEYGASDLRPNHITDGFGHVYEIPDNGYSSKFEYKGYQFRYNYDTRELEMLKGGEVIYTSALDAVNWFDGPSYWIKSLYNEFAQLANNEAWYEDEAMSESKAKGVKITEDYNIFINKPLKEFLATLDGKTIIGLKTSGDMPNFGGRVLQITWQYADKPIKSIEETERGLIVSLDR